MNLVPVIEIGKCHGGLELTSKNPKTTHEPRQMLNIFRTQGSDNLTAVLHTEHRGSAHWLQPHNIRAQRDQNTYLLLEEIQNAMSLGKHVDDFLQRCAQQVIKNLIFGSLCCRNEYVSLCQNLVG